MNSLFISLKIYTEVRVHFYSCIILYYYNIIIFMQYVDKYKKYLFCEKLVFYKIFKRHYFKCRYQYNSKTVDETSYS